jgi:hypothetical protein
MQHWACVLKLLAERTNLSPPMQIPFPESSDVL